RRHTRFSRDWSSDVCSSDLGTEVFLGLFVAVQIVVIQKPADGRTVGGVVDPFALGKFPNVAVKHITGSRPIAEVKTGYSELKERSEERRVGKESRARWGANA